MKAFVYKMETEKEYANGSFSGLSGSMVSNDYKTMQGLNNFLQKKSNQWGKPVRAEVHFNWDNRYKNPDLVLFVENKNV